MVPLSKRTWSKCISAQRTGNHQIKEANWDIARGMARRRMARRRVEGRPPVHTPSRASRVLQTQPCCWWSLEVMRAIMTALVEGPTWPASSTGRPFAVWCGWINKPLLNLKARQVSEDTLKCLLQLPCGNKAYFHSFGGLPWGTATAVLLRREACEQYRIWVVNCFANMHR